MLEFCTLNNSNVRLVRNKHVVPGPFPIVRDRRGSDRMVVGFTTDLQSVPITTNVVSWNPVLGKVYSIQHYVMTFVNDLRQVDDFLRVGLLRFPPPIKLTEILLKVALNTKNQIKPTVNIVTKVVIMPMYLYFRNQ